MPLPRPRNESTSKRFNINDAFIRTISSQMKKLVSSYGSKKEGETSSHYSSIISPQLSLQIPPLESKESLGIHEGAIFPKKIIPILSSMDKSLKGIKKDLEKKNKGDKIEEKMFSSIKNFFTSKSKPQQKDISKKVSSPKQFLPKVPSKKNFAIGTALGLGAASSLMNVINSSSSLETNKNHISGGNPSDSSGGSFFDGILSKVLTTVLEGTAGVMGLKILKEKIFGGLSKGGEIAKGGEGLAEAAKVTKVTEGIKATSEVAKVGGDGLGAAIKTSKLTKAMKAIPLIGEAAMVVEGAVDNSKEILDTGVLSFSTVGKRAKENSNAAFDTNSDFFTLDRLSGSLGLLQNAVIDMPLAVSTNVTKGIDDLTGGKITGYVSDVFQQIASNGRDGYDGAGLKNVTSSGLTSSSPITQANKESGLTFSSTPSKEVAKESGLVGGVTSVSQANKESAWGNSISSSSNYSFGGPVSISSEKKDVSKESKETSLSKTTNSLSTSTVNNTTNDNSKVTPGINGLSVSSSNLTFNNNSNGNQEQQSKESIIPSIKRKDFSLDEINPIKMDWSSWSKPVNKIMNENVSEVINNPLGIFKKITESMPQEMSLEKMSKDVLRQLPRIPGLSGILEMKNAISNPMDYLKNLLGFGGGETGEESTKDKSSLSNPLSNPMDYLKNLLGFGGEESKTQQNVDGLTNRLSPLNLQDNSSKEILNSIFQGNSNQENKIPTLLNNPQSSSDTKNLGTNPFSYLEQLQQQTTLATTNKVETSSPIVVPVPPPAVVVNNSTPQSKKPLPPYSPDPSSLRDLMAGNRLSFA